MRIVLFAIAISSIISCNRSTMQPIVKDYLTIKNVVIHEEAFSVGPCEPTICISPNDPNIIAAGSVLDNFYISKDGGTSWTNSKLTSSHGVYGDPVIRMDYQDNIYYSHLVNPKNRAYQSEEFLNKILVQRSSDYGATWTDGTYPEVDTLKDHDKQWLFIPDNSNEVVMTWTEFDKYNSNDPADKSRILFSKSVDGADTWTPAVAISDYEGNCLDNDQTTEGALPLKIDNGTYLVSWSYDNQIWLDKSTDGGVTWGQDIVVSDQPGGWTYDIPGIGRCNGMPIIDNDRSNGPYAGNIYINWSDQRNGVEDTDIWLAKSTDNGANWSSPIRVNNDEAGKQQFFTWMDIDPSTGYIYCVFYDRREHDDISTDVYLAYSTDGGETFKNIKINENSFTPNTLVFFGDYNDISVKNGIVRPIWTQVDLAKLSVHTALIDMNTK